VITVAIFLIFVVGIAIISSGILSAPESEETPISNAVETTRAMVSTPPSATLTFTTMPSNQPTLSPEERLQTLVVSNSDWVPIEQDFDSVKLVLVPVGCFMMGSDNGSKDEQPVHEQCFEEPFWIDKYEVTNEQYGSIKCDSSSSNPKQPRNCVDWFEAKAFCEKQGARLPTEQEWEYAARGPDSLVYPWGNDWNDNYAVWDGNSGYITAEVGSRPEGVSWVGAYDMSGNVWEWTSSRYTELY
jgi:formylglycine-generating enzyme required for sulfatase activity